MVVRPLSVNLRQEDTIRGRRYRSTHKQSAARRTHQEPSRTHTAHTLRRAHPRLGASWWFGREIRCDILCTTADREQEWRGGIRKIYKQLISFSIRTNQTQAINNLSIIHQGPSKEKFFNQSKKTHTHPRTPSAINFLVGSPNIKQAGKNTVNHLQQ